MPRQIFQLISDLQQAAYYQVSGGKGSHRKFRHAQIPGSVILSGKDGDDGQTLSGKASAPCYFRSFSMKPGDQYLKFVRWEDEDAAYVGYCPDLFPFGGVCHGQTEESTFSQLCELVRDEVKDLLNGGKELPPSTTRPMRDAIPA